MWCELFHWKETSHTDAAGLPLQEHKDEGKEKQEEKKEEQTVEHKEADGSTKHKDMGVKGAGDWLREQEEENSDWPTERVCHTHERAIPIQQTVETLDITEEGEWTHKYICW